MAQVGIRTYSKEEQLVTERRQQITKGALHLFIKNGYHQTSVRQIAEACDMSVGCMYHYVGSKEDILYLLIEDTSTKALKAMQELSDTPHVVQALTRAIDRWDRAIDEFQDMTLFTYQEMRSLSRDMRVRLQDIDLRAAALLEKIISDGVRQGKFHVENIKLLSHTIVVLGHMWSFRRWFLRKHCTLEEYIQFQKQLILRAAGVPEVEMTDE